MSFSPYAQSGPRRNSAPKRATGQQTPKKGRGRKGPPPQLLAIGLSVGIGFALWNQTRSDGGNPPEPSQETLATASAPASPEDAVATAEGPQTPPAETKEATKSAETTTEATPQAAGNATDSTQQAAPAQAQAVSALPDISENAVNDRIRPGETLSAALAKHNVSMDAVNRLVLSLKGMLDMRGIRPGDAYTIVEMGIASASGKQTDGGAAFKMDKFIFQPDRRGEAPFKIKATRIEKENPKTNETEETYDVIKETATLETRVVPVSGEVKSSLYQAMVDRGEGSDLVNRFVDVFAWNVDFYRETQTGDRYKALVEKKYADGRFVGYGRVLAAEYQMTHRTHRGFLYHSDDGKVVGIYDDKGGSLEKTFLKNPLEIARITSRYGQRFHPVLRRHKKHNGVDYGARTGTPFWSVADGVVKEARYSRTAGNMMVIRHINGYQTEYFHAVRLAKHIRPGVRVKQREIIGYVGSTGRSTGPHLHFGMKKRGSYVDPGKQIFPAAKPVPAKYKDEFLEKIAPLIAEMKALEIS